ncbi:hypothetical protein MANES_14G051250v8 [Manihot esculenta]|uniref:Uncharacterized protein n=1 Tax=Manihot esculenta TaxID=3983 RepID=A0ACB7GEB7_MANES|nr:hypothetical protein MANES_14G051250v8 [Manihot esculenta]
MHIFVFQVWYAIGHPPSSKIHFPSLASGFYLFIYFINCLVKWTCLLSITKLRHYRARAQSSSPDLEVLERHRKALPKFWPDKNSLAKSILYARLHCNTDNTQRSNIAGRKRC